MLPQKYRLNWKDVNFLTKKRQYFPAWIFGIFYFNQYSNRDYNQFSFHVSIKLSKHSTTRNVIKRIIIELIRQKEFNLIKINNQFYKFFVTLNKNRIPELQKVIESKDRKTIVKYVQDNFMYWMNKFSSLNKNKTWVL